MSDLFSYPAPSYIRWQRHFPGETVKLFSSNNDVVHHFDINATECLGSVVWQYYDRDATVAQNLRDGYAQERLTRTYT
jgi:hypothetical protein